MESIREFLDRQRSGWSSKFAAVFEAIGMETQADLVLKYMYEEWKQFHFFSLKPLEELTFDYKYQEGSRRIECHCGAPNCRKWLY